MCVESMAKWFLVSVWCTAAVCKHTRWNKVVWIELLFSDFVLVLCVCVCVSESASITMFGKELCWSQRECVHWWRDDSTGKAITAHRTRSRICGCRPWKPFACGLCLHNHTHARTHTHTHTHPHTRTVKRKQTLVVVTGRKIISGVWCKTWFLCFSKCLWQGKSVKIVLCVCACRRINSSMTGYSVFLKMSNVKDNEDIRSINHKHHRSGWVAPLTFASQH